MSSSETSGESVQLGKHETALTGDLNVLVRLSCVVRDVNRNEGKNDDDN